MPITTTWTSPARPSASIFTGRPVVTSGNSYLLTNGGSYLLTNGTDKLIIAVGTTGTTWTTNR